MKRREFLINTGLSVVAISASGFIKFDGKHFIGDCETTSDILGPYYRPNSPIRNNLVIKGEQGTFIELSGIIKHDDCKTPYKNAKVELWHCDTKAQYDNTQMNFVLEVRHFQTIRDIIHLILLYLCLMAVEMTLDRRIFI